ncbi:WG repeat-containing protein [Tissierella sp. MSJ-40]|uniref:WG repeat-containing protein n=1 Tax=Tissierella simiarum TaxID=2841534 RepID=A0ABS6EAD1_9FIRM|nr:WG repeat-containing protein [Tissierella simiarum]MBU5439714.1 WG repeat-containing protein [Tissierella simiarum]
MKRGILLALAVIIAISLIGCVNKTEEKEIISLYPAYKVDGNFKYWGYMDEKGEFKINPKYDAALDFTEEGLAKVQKENLIGVVDKEGKEILPTAFQGVSNFENGFITAYRGNEFFIFNYKGEQKFSTKDYAFLGSHKDGLFLVAKQIDKNNVKMGFIDENGKEVIEPKYDRVWDFYNDKALVQEGEGKYKIIDKSGKTIKEFSYSYMAPDEKNETYLFKDENQLYGYLNRDGEILVEPKFESATVFEDGYANVLKKTENNILWGAINEKGEYIVEPEYTNLINLGKGFFGISQVEDGSTTVKYAIINPKGETITGFDYYNVGGREGLIKNDIISVYDGEKTYALNLKGEKVNEVPEIVGRGEVAFNGKVTRAYIDGRMIYYNDKEKTIWEEDNTYVLREDAKVLEKKYTSGKDITIYYPVIEGLSDKKVEDNINKEIYKIFVTDVENSLNKEGNIGYVNTDYRVKRNNDLLFIHKSSSYHMEDAAHDLSLEESFHISLRNGTFFQLKDLFKEGSDYIGVLSNIIKSQMERRNNEGTGMFIVDDFKSIREDQGFMIQKDRIEIYFQPYEVTSYAEGFPKFAISYNDIMDILDTNSDFWWTFMSSRGF